MSMMSISFCQTPISFSLLYAAVSVFRSHAREKWAMCSQTPAADYRGRLYADAIMVA